MIKRNNKTPKNLASAGAVPGHIAIIMDGNGRWAKAKGLPRIAGHKEGANRVLEIFEATLKNDIKYLTLYAFSSENWNRPKLEVKALMSLLLASIKKYGKLFVEKEVRFLTIGDTSALPQNCQDALNALKKKTEHFTKSNLVLALNYGSRDELVRAINKIKKRGEITWQDIAENLDTANIPDPDLIIRTSGEMRLSNYLLLQSAYSELYFTDVNWPDFNTKEFEKAIASYTRRERRYGLTTEQIKND